MIDPPIYTPDVAGKLHQSIKNSLEETGGNLYHLPGLLYDFIKGEGWREIIRPTDGAVAHHDTVREWIESPKWSGLHTTPAMIFAIAEKTTERKDGDRLIELLGEHAITRTTATAMAARRLDEPGRPAADPNVDNINNKDRTKGGTAAAYLAGVLKRDHAAIAEALERGEYRSVRAAARAAGILKEYPLADLRHRSATV